MLLLLFFVTLVRTAWFSDDALITLRNVLNLLHGYGATFNIEERVQAYTHPLWFLLISASTAILGNVYFSLLLLSVMGSLLCLWLLIRRIDDLSALLFPALLLLSKAFVDFSTSGLENPLTHVLLAIAVPFFIREGGPEERSRRVAFLVSGLLYLSRPDALLLLLPIVSLTVIRSSTKGKDVSLFLIAPVLWTLLSLFYYGFPFPNTAYAKLSTGISRSELFYQGSLYLVDSLSRDPITLMTIPVASVLAWKSGWQMRSLAFGIILHLLYIVAIGGDFMSGRFLTPALLVSVMILIELIQSSQERFVLALPLLLLGMIGIRHTILADPSLHNLSWSQAGIADERAYYFQGSSLVHANRYQFRQPEWKKATMRVVLTCGGLGRMGIGEGPSAYIVDPCALSDPLLARLPIMKDDPWRIGHFHRQLPTGYLESIETGENSLTDAGTREYYDAIRSVTRDPLWNLNRLKTVLRLNLGLVQKPDRSAYRNSAVPMLPGARAVRLLDVLDRTAYRETFIDHNAVPFDQVLEIVLPELIDLHRYEVRLQGQGRYRLEVLGADWRFHDAGIIGAGLTMSEIPDTSEWARSGRRVRITALSGSKHALERFRPR
jgi:arabinofuranosyltransferase